MYALVHTAEGPVVRSNHPLPARPSGEAEIALSLGGICATDLELVQGYMGFTGVLGHEWVGRVLRSDDPRWIGKRVVGDINCPCGSCATCRAGRPTHCPQRSVLGIQDRDGAFRERFHLPEANLHAVPNEVPDEAAVFVEPLAAALEVLEQVHLRPSQRAIVLGVGRLGQLCARVLALTGAQVTGVGRSPTRLALLPPGIRRSAEPESLARADVVVDCTGSATGLGLATRLVRPRGTLVLKTTVHGQSPQSPTPWVIDEITVVGSRCGPFGPALRLLASGVIDPTPLITARYPLAEGEQALRAAARPEHTKVLLETGER